MENRVVCRLPIASLLLAIAGCSPPPMHWAGPGDATRDQADCQSQADQTAANQLPYGDGPPIYGFYSNWSMLTWKQEIDNERYYLARDLMRACMQSRGYQLVPGSQPAASSG